MKIKASQYEEVFMSQPEKEGTQESAKSTTVIKKKSKGFADEERAAMREFADRREHVLEAFLREGLAFLAGQRGCAGARLYWASPQLEFCVVR